MAGAVSLIASAGRFDECRGRNRGYRNRMETDAERPAQGRKAAFDRVAEISHMLADTAEAIAETAELSARVHDDAADVRPGVSEHAERDRRFAAAERAAAAAHRRGEVPSDEIRQVIRDVGRAKPTTAEQIEGPG
jgi:hypothetical protein